MSTLTPEQLNAEFLKHFMPETLYLLDAEHVPVASVPEPAVIPDFQLPAPVVVPEQKPAAPAAPAAAIPKLPKMQPTPQPKSFDSIGENRKGLIVLVTLPDAAFKALPEDQFLTKILAAIGFGPEDVAFVNNVSGAVTKFEALRETTKTNYIISFASRLDTDLPHEKFTLYNPVPVDGIPVVFSQSLAVLDGDQDQKKLLWGALQRVFKK